MADVMITVAHQRPVGAFMTAVSRAPEASRPKTVEEFMNLLAGYLNKHFLDPANRADPASPAPELSPGIGATPGEAKAEFVAGSPSDKGGKAVGSWSVHPYIEVANVRRNAALELRCHTPETVVMRMPQPELLAQAEKDARLLSIADGTDRFTGPSYYYDYFSTRDGITTMEYLWSRIADYTTASCR